MIRVFTTFSGYDSQCLALKYAGIPFELVGWSEIDKYAITAHNALFPEYAERNYGDVTKIEWNTVPDFDLLTWSSPCQDISQAGKQRGLQKDSGTRSSLIWHILEAARIKKPKYMLMENVAALVSQKFLPHLNAVLRQIEELGYTNRWQVLNAKDYGVPQNRERVFVVSSLDASEFYFPPTIRLDKRLKDVLESNVDEKYYLNDKTIKSMIEHCERKQAEGCGFKFDPKDGGGISQAITTAYGGRQTDCYIKENETKET